MSYALDPAVITRRVIHAARQGRTSSFDESPVGDLQREALAAGLKDWLDARKGTLYLACNPAAPNLYKIGRTRLPVAERMRALNGPGVLVPWTEVMAWAVYDAPGLEAAAHRACSEFLIHGELFQAPWHVLAARIEGCLQSDLTRLQQNLGSVLEDSLPFGIQRQ